MARKLLCFVLIFKKICIQNLSSVTECKENSFKNDERKINKSAHKFIEYFQYFAKNGGNIAVLSIVSKEISAHMQDLFQFSRLITRNKNLIFIFKKFKKIQNDFGCRIKTPVSIFKNQKF